MRALAALPHVSAKISGFGMFDASWSMASITSLVLETIEMFGVDRCTLGSNFPVDRLWTTYTKLLDVLDSITSGLASPTV